MVDCTVIEETGRDNPSDDLLEYLSAKISRRDLFGMLGRDDNGVYAKGDGSTTILLVLDGDLRLRIRSKPGKGPATARNSHRGVELMRKHDGQGHQLLRLISRISKHDTLITCAMVLQRAVIETLRDVWRLLLDSNEDVTGFVVKPFRRVVVANLLDSLPNDFLVINLGFGGDLAEDHDHAGLACSLASDLGERVLGKTCV
jgi:hypothetical protein